MFVGRERKTRVPNFLFDNFADLKYSHRHDGTGSQSFRYMRWYAKVKRLEMLKQNWLPFGLTILRHWPDCLQRRVVTKFRDICDIKSAYMTCKQIEYF
jgi:hypothetical protein